MCGIAGVVDLAGGRHVPPGTIEAMAQALVHRGPDEDGFFVRPGLALANRRLSIVGLADGRQPLYNEDRTVAVVYNGELFDYPEERQKLEKRGHRFLTHCDTELLPHLWEEHDEGMFERLRGQFAVALWDQRQQRLVLGRDRFGICPLYWTRQGDWLLFASEIKGLLASGLVDVRPNLEGINHIFTFFALPGPVTCFQGIQLLPAGHYLRIQRAGPGQPAQVSEHTYWEIDFPERGQEERGKSAKQLLDGFEEVLLRATEKRLRADVPVVSYLSGGLDSTTVVALANHVRKKPIQAFTIRIDHPDLDETTEATIAGRHVGTEPIVVNCGAEEVLQTYPRLIRAAEAPVLDTSCAALLLLAQEVHARGYKVALTGEGADEWLAGYPWYKIDKLLGVLDVLPGLSQTVRRSFLWLNGSPNFPREFVARVQAAAGGHNPWLDLYGMVSLAKLRFFSPWLREQLADHIVYADLGINLERMRRWHPLNRALYFGIRVHLPGLLLNAKGDRVAMHSSVETRYPYLDEDVFAYLAPLAPRWKMRGFKEKYLLRRLAERWLPTSIAWRRKAMFRAPFDSFFSEDPAKVPAFVDQLLSPESLRQTGYFDLQAVQHWRHAFRTLRAGSTTRVFLEMGLVGVVATQLWHHTYIEGCLADLPTVAAKEVRSPQVQEHLAG
jgi:asparagine synthase (glutamine-hydrolysing)